MNEEFFFWFAVALVFYGIIIVLVCFVLDKISMKKYAHIHFKKTERYRRECQ